ncbi:MAG: DUF58 domain-containing protein [Planctomycetales bacterium]|nr:DUF58 domain-containing protein [Planctomycetales bacterium]
MKPSPAYFDPETLSKIASLDLRARTLVEGLTAGLHRSPLRGHSIEFAQHREYVAGDDLRQVDWKVYARSDKHYLKQYEDETNLACYVLVDQSASMLYQGEQSFLNKLQYAQLIACSISYLVISQQDSVGLVTFSAGIDEWLPPLSSPSQFDDMIRIFEHGNHRPLTQLARTLEAVLKRIRKPSLLFLISDLLCDVDGLLTTLRLARYARHDVMVMQVLDSDELLFPFDQLGRFEGMEEPGHLVTDPVMIGGAYRKAAEEYCKQIELGCRQLEFDYFLTRTDTPLTTCLSQALAARRR